MKTSDRQPAVTISPTVSSNSKPKAQSNFWLVFNSTFITIFLAEMGDKTQLVTLLMTAESQSPVIVFIGSALALIATSLIGVSIGYWLSKKLAPETLDLSVAILLMFITAWLVSDIINL
ncbi:MAG: TMEM165/GDT1 family protein [Cyanobacteria bacterium P01_G01_bin.39]